MKPLLSCLFLTLHLACFSQEICNNGIDDDFDGLIDLQDTTDCFCNNATSLNTVVSLVPNPSFEQRTCCPSGASQLNCANNWIQASGATSDYFNTCGITAIGSFPPPPLPLPNGNGYVGFFDNFGSLNLPYKEFVGTCLTDTLKTGVNYQLEFYLANSFGNLTTEIAIYGTTNCSSLPFGNLLPTASSFCPTTVAPIDWTLIKIDSVTCSSSSWVKATINFTSSQNYTAIILGGSCNNNPGSNYYYMDSLMLNESILFNSSAQITDNGHYCKGNLVLEARFGSSPISFQWYKDSIALVGDTNSTYLVPIGGLGNYQVRLQYDSGCVITETYKVDTTIISFGLNSRGTCPLGSQTGLITIDVDSVNQSFDYSLNNGPFVTDSFFNQLSAGNYKVTVRDSNLCETSSVILVDSFPMPIASFIVDSVCLGETTTFIDNSRIGKGIITQWSWDIVGLPTTQNTSFTFGLDGIFPVTQQVVSDSGCIDDTTINVLVHPLPKADFSFSPTEVYTFNPEVCFTNLSVGTISSLWDFDFVGINGTSSLSDPCNILFPSEEEKDFTVTLTTISEFGCMDSIQRIITISNNFIFYVPNAFSPNDDGINDEFKVIVKGIESYELLVFNKWGELMFSSTEVDSWWDGKHENAIVPAGVYIYKINLKGENRLVKEVIGHVNVIR